MAVRWLIEVLRGATIAGGNDGVARQKHGTQERLVDIVTAEPDLRPRPRVGNAALGDQPPQSSIADPELLSQLLERQEHLFGTGLLARHTPLPHDKQCKGTTPTAKRSR